MIVIAGPAKSGKTKALATLCMADPDGVFYPSFSNTYGQIANRFPGIRLSIARNVTGRHRCYIDEPVPELLSVEPENIAAVTARVEK